MVEPMPYTGQPPQSPYGPGVPPPRDTKTSSTNTVVIVLLVVIVVGAGLFMAFFFFIGSMGDDTWEENMDFESEVFIAEEGHYRHFISDSWEERVEVNFTVSLTGGGPFDVYIMDQEQYDNSYGNMSTGSFSSTFSWENVSVVHDVVELENTRTMYYLVIDNTEMSFLPDSAQPEGPVSMDVEIHATYFYNMSW
jgi:hypothetical protein